MLVSLRSNYSVSMQTIQQGSGASHAIISENVYLLTDALATVDTTLIQWMEMSRQEALLYKVKLQPDEVSAPVATKDLDYT